MKFQLTEKGLVAILTLAVCGTLIGMGNDTVIGYTLLAVIVGYFGIEVWPLPQIKTRKKGE